MEGQGLRAWWFSTGSHGSWQHLLDFDRDTVAIDQHHAGSHRQVVGEDPDLVRLGGIQLDDGAAGEPHDLVDGHCGGTEHHHEIDADFIEGRHF